MGSAFWCTGLNWVGARCLLMVGSSVRGNCPVVKAKL